MDSILRTRLVTTALAAAFALLVSACGKDRDESAETGDSTPAANYSTGPISNPEPIQPMALNDQQAATSNFNALKTQAGTCGSEGRKPGKILQFMTSLLAKGQGVRRFYTLSDADAHGFNPSPRGLSCMGGMGQLTSMLGPLMQNFDFSKIFQFLMKLVQGMGGGGGLGALFGKRGVGPVEPLEHAFHNLDADDLGALRRAWPTFID